MGRLTLMSERFRHFLGLEPRPRPPVEQARERSHAAEEFRHNVVDTQLQELTSKLEYLSLEARADAGLYGRRQDSTPHPR